MTPVESASANLLDRDAEVHATSPFTPGAGTEQHAQRLDDARQVLNTAPQEALNAVPRPAATSYADVPFASVKGRIQGGESRGDYNVVVYGEKAPKPITSMSLGEVFDFQRGPLRDRTRGRRGDGDVGSTGVGAYQFESRTLEQNARALYGDKWRDVQFSPATQDALAEHLWNSVRGKPGMLANTWATFGSKREAGAPVLRRDQFANDEEWASVSI